MYKGLSTMADKKDLKIDKEINNSEVTGEKSDIKPKSKTVKKTTSNVKKVKENKTETKKKEASIKKEIPKSKVKKVSSEVKVVKKNTTNKDNSKIKIEKVVEKDDFKIQIKEKVKIKKKKTTKTTSKKEAKTHDKEVGKTSAVKKTEVEEKIEKTKSVETEVITKKSECKLFFFMSNYSELYPIYNEKLDIQFNNIKELVKNEVEALGGAIKSSDYSSMTILPVVEQEGELNNENKETEFSFDDVLGISFKIYEAIEYYYKLTKRYEFPLKFHCGIMYDDSEIEKNPFRKSFLGMKKVDSSKKSKKVNVNYSNNYLPFTLLSEKTALSIIENYNIFKSDFRSNIWYTDGIKVTESERLNKIYLNRDEEDIIDSFINDRDFSDTKSESNDNNGNYNKRKKILLLSGELGSGKTKIVDEVINNSLNNSSSSENSIVILKVTEKKHTEKEYYLIVKIIESLIEVFKDELNIDVNEIIEMINSESIEDINKNNLINLVKRYFDDLYLDKNGVSFYNLSIRLKIAFTDFLQMFFTYIDKHLTIVIDNYQYSNKYCENILLSVFNKKFSNIFDKINMILIGRDKDMMFNIKNYEKLKYQIYKKYLQNLDKTLISNFLQLTFPHKKITKGLVEFIFKITGGNFYTLKEYI